MTVNSPNKLEPLLVRADRIWYPARSLCLSVAPQFVESPFISDNIIFSIRSSSGLFCVPRSACQHHSKGRKIMLACTYILVRFHAV